MEIPDTVLYIIGFLVVSIAAAAIANVFQKYKLPLITGLIVTGIVTGPYFVGLISKEYIDNLSFINDMALAFIAFAAGAELYITELRGRLKSIMWMTFGQLVVTFVLTTAVLVYFAHLVPFMQGLNELAVLAVAMLTATIFVARSPASAIAIINELRAKGPFTQTALGVTVIKDVLVIILFAAVFSFSEIVISGNKLNISEFGLLAGELTLSFVLGFAAGKFIGFVFAFNLNKWTKSAFLLFFGWGIFLFCDFFAHYTQTFWNVEVHIEALLVSIAASFTVANYTKHRIEFLEIIEKTGFYVYTAFFLLTGASVSVDLLADSFFIALAFFFLRILSMFLGGFLGGYLSGDDFKTNLLAWTPYVTQAGVGLGLITIVESSFPDWGQEFATVLISVIVINQIVGPPLFKYALFRVKEAHPRAKTPDYDGVRDVFIFGLESQSKALAKLLKMRDWKVKIITCTCDIQDTSGFDIEIVKLDAINLENLKKINTKSADVIVALNTDEENLLLCTLIYEHFGTKQVVVRLNDRNNLKKFTELGVYVVDPSRAMVGLLDHFVRSPKAAELLLGLDEGRDTQDIEVRNPNIHGLALRNLRLPLDTLVLSVTRGGQKVISHGYTRLRLGDVITIVGSVESLDQVRLRFEGE